MTTQSKSRPNIIVCLVDDLGFSDIGCYGSEIRTPNLDRMGNSGLRFTQMYNAARCCPSRAALLTGSVSRIRRASGHMVQNYGRPGYQGYLNDSCMTIAEVLRTAGYRTLMSGKWHVGGHYHPPSTRRGLGRWLTRTPHASTARVRPLLRHPRRLRVAVQPILHDAGRHAYQRGDA